jgi:predicted extracellular nuclease
MKNRLSEMFSVTLVLTLIASLLSTVQPALASASSIASPTDAVFINEIHYDNTGTDAGEAIEIFGPAGTNLTGWSIVLVNGSGGAVYDTDALSGTIPDLCGGFGVVSLNYPSNGIQNGSPDGIALYDGTTVVQFLSYEGTFTGFGGVTDGLISTDIGVSETGSEPLGMSLQLTGTGSLYGDFVWNAPATASFGSINPGQTCSTDAAPYVSSTTPADGAMDVTLDANINVTFNEPVNVSGSWFNISCGISGPHSAVVSGGPNTFTLNPDIDLETGESCTVTIFAEQVTDQDSNDPPDNMESDYDFSFDTVGAPGPSVFINEIHYDNAGTDIGEAIEIAGPTCTDLTDWSVVLYNGNGGAVYNTATLSGPIPNLGGGFGVVVVTYPSNGIQNGSPDGMALVDHNSNVIQFLSYEGALTATDGPANGMLSEDIGVSEGTSTPIGYSLQLTGSGSTYNNFTWAPEAAATFGAFNAGQTFTGGGITNPCGVGTASPNLVFAGDATLLTVSVISGTNPPSTGLAVTADLSAIGGSASQTFYNDGTNGDVTAGDGVFSYSTTVAVSTSPGVLALPATITDVQGRTGSASIGLTIKPPLVAIHAIQGASHVSPLKGELVSTQGVVTAKTSSGFYMQDSNPDADVATSEGIFVFTSSSPAVAVGDSVEVTGTVQEFRPGGVSNGNLTTTEISNPGRTVTVLSSGNPLPAPTVIGTGGRTPPTDVIENDNSGDIETDGNIFDPSEDGIDFYESLEGMLVQVNSPVAVGPTNAFGEVPIVPDNGAWASVRTPRGGILLRQNDGNPERLVLDDLFVSVPAMNVGDYLNGAVIGVLDYNFGNFFLEATNPLPSLVSGGLMREVTGDPTDYQLSVASFNVENLSPNDPPSKFETLAGLIVNNLKSPDVIGLEEIQDNNGATDDGTVDASDTLSLLVAAIQTAGGPYYEYRQINPVNDEDGGQPGGNIRVGFLFNPDRVDFVDRSGGTSTTAVGVVSGANGPELTFSPGRIDPNNVAFTDSRKPLAGEFIFKGDTVFVLVNHFNSKGGDDPLFGHFQPPVLGSEVQRLAQATVVHDFIAEILNIDPDANVVVLGDLNDYQFSNPLNVLKSGILVDLVETLPLGEQYTYVFDGNSQVLDHILASNRLASVPFKYDVVHVNSEFSDQASDHEPEVALMCVDRTAPTLSVTVSPDTLWPPDHNYVDVAVTVTYSDNADSNPTLTFVSATSNEPDNGDDDGDTVNDIVKVDDTHFKLRAERSGIGTGRIYTITYKVTDACGNETTQSATVRVPLSQGN